MLTLGVASVWILLSCIVVCGLHLASDGQSTRRAIRRKLGGIAGVTKTTAIMGTPNEWFAIVTVSRECDLINTMQQALLRLDGPLRTKMGLSAAKTITITVEHTIERTNRPRTDLDDRFQLADRSSSWARSAGVIASPLVDSRFAASRVLKDI